jgi:hypothetical protein
MIELITDLPETVLGLKAVGTVSAEDYAKVVVPAVEDKLSRFPRLRLLYVLGPDFTGFTAGAAWNDAQLGLKHFTTFERVAVVTDQQWLDMMVRAMGFVMPGEVETFRTDRLAEARAWITLPASRGNLEFSLDRDTGVLVLQPHGQLEAADFERVAAEVDPLMKSRGDLAGMVIVAEAFPGWDNLSAITAHLRFVREHIGKIRRVALVTGSEFLAAVPQFAQHFVDAQVRRFPMDERDAAVAWASGQQAA